MKKVLNLYGGIGGNRKKWGNQFKVTMVENDRNIARIYQDQFPADEVIIDDAHKFLLQHYKEFDFIWSSPPCQSHSQVRKNMSVGVMGSKALYPDMKLYEEILFLKHYFKGKWVVENTRSFYKPLIEPQDVGKHFFWANFEIRPFNIGNRNHRKGTVETLQKRKEIDISRYGITNKRQILRNCVEPELGLHILKEANL